MSETVVYIRAPFPFPPEFGVPDDLIRDARILLEIDTAQVEGVRSRLGAFNGFLDRATIDDVLAAVGGEA